MISLTTAREMAHAAVLAHCGAVQSLVLLNAVGPEQTSFVFRADQGRTDLGHADPIIVKIGDPLRVSLAAARLADVYPLMNEGRFRVPKVLAHDAGAGVLMMEDARGQSAHRLFLSGQAGATRAIAAGGAWIARFHKPFAHMATFNPDPHVNWLHKQITAHHAGDRMIPDFARFSAAFQQLRQICEIARGQPILRTVTHRDYHLRNVVIRNLGRTYGIDFENSKRDEALRDLLFFTADAAKIALLAPTAASVRAIATALRAAYSRPLGAKISCQAFQLAFALAGWASLDQARSPFGPNRARALAVMQMMAETDDLFPDFQSVL